jgi:hypothetical protein
MKSPIPVKRVMPVEKLFGEDPEDTRLLGSMALDAENYLRSFSWCESIEGRYFGAGIGGVVGIFLFGIVPAHPDIDEWLWVVVGDLPSAYLVADDCKVPSEVLATYIELMRRWTTLAKSGRTSPEVIPVNVPATPEWAKELEGRLDFLEDDVLPQFRDDEFQRA